MMETKHTAGPWRVGDSHSWNIMAGERTLIGSAHFGGYTANAKERAEVDANARLMAAAPELLDVCHAIETAFMEGHESNGGFITIRVNQYDLARLQLAILLAEGNKVPA